MALISSTDLKSLDIYKSLNVIEYSKEAVKIFDYEIIDGILCHEITIIKTSDGFTFSFYSKNLKLFEEADYYFDSINNNEITRELDKLYKSHKGKRKFRDNMDDFDIHISINKQGQLVSTILIVKNKEN